MKDTDMGNAYNILVRKRERMTWETQSDWRRIKTDLEEKWDVNVWTEFI